jgi:hypothetical protein
MSTRKSYVRKRRRLDPIHTTRGCIDLDSAISHFIWTNRHAGSEGNTEGKWSGMQVQLFSRIVRVNELDKSFWRQMVSHNDLNMDHHLAHITCFPDD